MSTHVVLGGCGFIGRHVALGLLRRGDSVVLADVVEPSAAIAETLPVPFRLVEQPEPDWKKLTQDADVVHHYAWTTIPSSANADPVADLESNLRETVRLLEALRLQKVETGFAPKVIFSSSGGTVYGRVRHTPVPESQPYNPNNAYGASKAAAEIYLGSYRASHGIDCRIARISNPYGAGQNPARRQGAASTFLFQALAGESIAIWGDGSVVRDYIHIADLVAALLALADAPPERLGGLDEAPIFNIGSGEGVSLNGILDVLRGPLCLDPIVEYQPERPFDVPVSVLDINKANQLLDWSPRLSFGDGYALMLKDVLGPTPLFSTLLGTR
ncbi:NAD-dependent epimerase/dehydratase family protein [Devosia naphthalenivorans]|uniref:NAD-dependent epimerase/dehydratase family protein n=1 Tax=Devosia naphthalenivorans TaxID=2082392 RepID=UPI000D3AE9DF|nr:NAD-dependent epimerase/dehydratase family protein [Devosia naphthalenivorans]